MEFKVNIDRDDEGKLFISFCSENKEVEITKENINEPHQIVKYSKYYLDNVNQAIDAFKQFIKENADDDGASVCWRSV